VDTQREVVKPSNGLSSIWWSMKNETIQTDPAAGSHAPLPIQATAGSSILTPARRERPPTIYPPNNPYFYVTADLWGQEYPDSIAADTKAWAATYPSIAHRIDFPTSTTPTATATSPKRKRRKISNPTPAEIAGADLIYERSDLIAYGQLMPDGRKPQTSRARLDRHFAAGFAASQLGQLCGAAPAPKSDFLPGLTKVRIMAGHRALVAQTILGGSPREADPLLYLRSNWNSGYLLVRFDADLHHAGDEIDDLPTGAKAFIEMLKTEYDLPVYSCRSARGHSGYLFLEVPTTTTPKTPLGDAKKIPQCTKAEMNDIVKNINKGINHIAKARGFACAAEAFGSFLEKTCDTAEIGPGIKAPSSASRIVELGSTVKQPLFNTLEDVAALKAATAKVNPRNPQLTHLGLRRLLADCLAAVPEKTLLAETEKLLAKAQATTTKTAKSRMANGKSATATKKYEPISRVIPDAGNMVKNTANCVSRAMAILHFRPGDDTAQVERLGLDLYTENNLSQSSGPEDADRVKRFAGFTAFMCGREWDADKCNGGGNGTGGSKIWFEAHHQESVERHMTGSIANHVIVKAQKQIPGYRIDRKVLALMACTVAKDAATNDGRVPTAAIRRMMEYHGIPSHGTQVKLCMDILIEAGVIVLVDYTYEIGRCRKWAIARPAWFTFAPEAKIAAPEGESHTARSFNDYSGIARDHAANEARKYGIISPGAEGNDADSACTADSSACTGTDPSAFFSNGYWGDASQVVMPMMCMPVDSFEEMELFGDIDHETDESQAF